MLCKKWYRSSYVTAIIAVATAIFLIPSAFYAEGTIDIIPDENVGGSVELKPGYMTV